MLVIKASPVYPEKAASMAPKNKDAGKSAGSKGKGKGKDDEGSAGGSGKLKAAQSINVRHILVGDLLVHIHVRSLQCLFSDTPSPGSARNTQRKKRLWPNCVLEQSLMTWRGNSQKTRPDKVLDFFNQHESARPSR